MIVNMKSIVFDSVVVSSCCSVREVNGVLVDFNGCVAVVYFAVSDSNVVKATIIYNTIGLSVSYAEGNIVALAV